LTATPLAASFPFPAQAKNIKTSLPNRPIHWQIIYETSEMLNFGHNFDDAETSLQNTSETT